MLKTALITSPLSEWAEKTEYGQQTVINFFTLMPSLCYNTCCSIMNNLGEVSEWSKVLDSKSSVVNSHRGFESHPLCH